MAVSVALGLTIPGTGSEYLMQTAPSRVGMGARPELEVRPDSVGPQQLRAAEKAFVAEKRVAPERLVEEAKLVEEVKLGRVRSLQRTAAARVIALSAEFKAEARRACKVIMDSPASVTPALVAVAVDFVAVAEDSAAVEPVVVEAAEAGGKS
jgi:hypothetical protein